MALSRSNSPVFVDASRHTIAIIGMGIGGASFLSSFVDIIRSEPSLFETACFLLFDTRPLEEFGRGVAWGSAQSDLFLANMRLHTMGLKADLIQKLKERAGVGGETAETDLQDNFLFHQRNRIGQVFHENFNDTLAFLEKNSVPYHVESNSITDINRTGRAFSIQTSGGADYFCDTVVLAVGNVPANSYPELRESENFVSNPWNWEQIAQLSSKRRVAIIGLGPTAVDAILLTNDSKAKSILAISHSGRIQYPRPHSEPYLLKHVTEHNVRTLANIKRLRNMPALTYESLFDSLSREFTDADACADYEEARKNSKLTPRDALFSGWKDSDKVSKWYSVMKAIDPITPFLWNELDEDGRRRYKSELKDDHTNLSYGMASIQAERLIKIIENKILKIAGGITSVTKNERGKFDIVYGSHRDTVDVVINCTGIGSTRDDFTGPLIRSMYDKGWIVSNPAGGAYVDFDSGQLLTGKNGTTMGEIYSLVGSLTKGTHLLTNCLGQVFESGDRTAQAIAKKLSVSVPRVL